MIPFNKPYLSGNELQDIKKAHSQGQLAGDGTFSKLCHEWLEQKTLCYKALLTHSCTAALEMAAMLIDIQSGDEVIMPSYTFVSTANAFTLRGATPVFADIRTDTLNIDENLIESLITPRTKAIIPVHYAGVSCNMNAIMKIAKRYNLFVIEDAAQGILAKYKGDHLGSIGELGCLSFHETKNIHCGEGGSLLINDDKFVERAEIIREKGTNRSQFFRGQIDKYRWIDIGSSYLPGELTASFLFSQLQVAKEITNKRLIIWNSYNEIFNHLEMKEQVKRPVIPDDCEHNAHMYYLLLNKRYDRVKVLEEMNKRKVNAVFHYQPLHSSLAGEHYGKTPLPLAVTEDISSRLIRLPMWVGFDQHERVLDALSHSLDL
jgi:dTDP-4-amino-4,6-dideoxygalactose transaminase